MQKGVNKDIRTVVEEPQVHILGRSTSSLDDQIKFIECRSEWLLDMGKVLCTRVAHQSTMLCVSSMEMAQQCGLKLEMKSGVTTRGNSNSN